MRVIDAQDTGTVDERVRAAAEELSAVAADIDRGRVGPDGNYQLMREFGLLRILIPWEAGGEGLSFLAYTKALETLATGDGATALGFNMHNVAIGSLCETAKSPLPEAAERFRTWVFKEVVENGRMFASATSETGTGAKLRQLQATYRASGDAYVLNGTKSFVSLAGIADYYVVAAREEGCSEAEEVSHFVVSRLDDGVAFSDPWDSAALRGTQTAQMSLKDVRIPRARLFLGVEGLSLFKLMREPHWMVSGYMGAYLGIAESILCLVVRLLMGNERRRSSPVLQAQVGRLAVELKAARALVYSAARLVDEEKGSLEANTAVHAAKYCIGELAPRLALDAVRICGSGSLRASEPLERLLREAAFCSVMPAKPDECLEYVGKATLGFNMFDARNFNW
ncbi:acyl-CoA dehydrogenase family protein [Streptomyces violaceusniger]|uniref:Acyl-CoA dehydrogenase n=1 Tax=Streptomyces violaceusniger TaxID=68280 RepID=A0A4D4KL57_STRVO|nr:acyl-CoA dehydrogenase [Streptomyces violaceusniger]